MRRISVTTSVIGGLDTCTYCVDGHVQVACSVNSSRQCNMTDLLISLLIWLNNIPTASRPVAASNCLSLRHPSLYQSLDTAEKRNKGRAQGHATLSGGGPTRDLSLRRRSFERQHTPLCCYATKFDSVSRSPATVSLRANVLSCRHFEKTVRSVLYSYF